MYEILFKLATNSFYRVQVRGVVHPAGRDTLSAQIYSLPSPTASSLLFLFFLYWLRDSLIYDPRRTHNNILKTEITRRNEIKEGSFRCARGGCVAAWSRLFGSAFEANGFYLIL